MTIVRHIYNCFELQVDTYRRVRLVIKNLLDLLHNLRGQFRVNIKSLYILLDLFGLCAGETYISSNSDFTRLLCRHKEHHTLVAPSCSPYVRIFHTIILVHVVNYSQYKWTPPCASKSKPKQGWSLTHQASRRS